MIPLEPAKRALTFFEEFKKFLFKGSMIDIAVGVVIGGAFNNIINSLVKNIFMPLIGAMTTGGKGEVGDVFKKLSENVNGVDVPYGAFIGDFINFVILGLVVYVVIVRFVGAILKDRHETPPEPPADVKLLTEIRDLLKEQRA